MTLEEMDAIWNEAKAKTVAEQDKALNTAWFVFGTKKELKDQKILSGSGLFKKGSVLKDGDVNKDYFTQVDIRTTKEIKLYSKDADILTTHPTGSYALEKELQPVDIEWEAEKICRWGAARAGVIEFEKRMNYNVYPSVDYTVEDWRKYRYVYYRLVEKIDSHRH